MVRFNSSESAISLDSLLFHVSEVAAFILGSDGIFSLA